MLTHKQKECHDYIRGYIADHGGVAPSHDEIMAALKFSSKGNVSRLIDALEERGVLRRMRHRSRALEIIPTARPQVPHVTYTRANAQLYVVENGDGQAKLVPLVEEPG